MFASSAMKKQAADGYQEQTCRFGGEEDVVDDVVVVIDIDKLNFKGSIVKPCAGKDVGSLVPVVVAADDLDMRVGHPGRRITGIFPRSLSTPDVIYTASTEYRSAISSHVELINLSA